MTLIYAGFDGNMTEADLSKMLSLAAGEVVVGMQPSAVAGDRTVSIAPGTAAPPGVVVENTAARQVQLDVNTTADPRIDAVVLETDWGGTGGTVVTTKVKGSPGNNPARPDLTRDAGSLWHTPLAYVRVDPGAGALPAGVVVDSRPGPRQAIPYSRGIAAVSFGVDATARELQVVEVDDPGWAYRLLVNAVVDFKPGPSGRATVRTTVDGVPLAPARSVQGFGGPAVVADACPRRTGKARVRFTCEPNGSVGGGPAETSPDFSSIVVTVVPA